MHFIISGLLLHSPPNPSSFSISLPLSSLTVWIPLVHVHSSVFPSPSPSPSRLYRVISLSYVCPSLYVCVPSLFVSDSFSRKIRDAYLVPLSSTDAVALGYSVWRWPRRQKPHARSSHADRSRGPEKPRPLLSTALHVDLKPPFGSSMTHVRKCARIRSKENKWEQQIPWKWNVSVDHNRCSHRVSRQVIVLAKYLLYPGCWCEKHNHLKHKSAGKNKMCCRWRVWDKLTLFSI